MCVRDVVWCGVCVCVQGEEHSCEIYSTHSSSKQDKSGCVSGPERGGMHTAFRGHCAGIMVKWIHPGQLVGWPAIT